MTQEDKQLLLLRDLCARVPYHPKGHVVNACNGARCDEWLTCATFTLFTNITNNCRLYLRPMSSMTEEEKRELFINVLDGQEEDYEDFCLEPMFDGQDYLLESFYLSNCVYFVNWCYKHHFDIMGLIPKGLAIEAPEGMYKE